MSRLIQGTILGLVALAVGASSESAQAQVRWGVSIGNGGGVRVGVGSGVYGPYGPGYYRGYYGPGAGYYGPGYGYGYGPTPIVVPQPVIVQQPNYVQPQPTYVQPQPQQQYFPSEPTNSQTYPSSSGDGGEIVIFSPSANQIDIRYNLNGRTYTMRPGTKQKFTNDRTWNVQFDAGNGQAASYTLKSARYKFKVTDTGIALYETQDTPEVGQPPLAPAPIPEPPTPGTTLSAPETVIPSRPPALKTTP